MAKRKSPLRCRSSANSEAGPKGEGQDARSKEKATLLGACRARATAPALPQLGHPCPRQPGKSVSRGRAFRQHIGQPLLRCLTSGIHAVAMCWRKGVDIVSTPLRACRPRLTASQGEWRSRSKATARATAVQACPSSQAYVAKLDLALKSPCRLLLNHRDL
jgi:hypothetical protein